MIDGEGVANVVPSDIMTNNTRLNSKTFENHMMQTRTLATFTTVVTVLVLFIASISTIQPVRGTSMTLGFGGSWIDCLAAHSFGTWTHIYNAGPSGKTWSVLDAIGLYGGDNTQYVHWNFVLIDNSQGTGVVQDIGSAIYWEQQSPPYMYGNTLAASTGGTVTVQSYISNDDGASQCFIVGITGYYY